MVVSKREIQRSQEQRSTELVLQQTPAEVSIEALLANTATYLAPADQEMIRAAFDLAAGAHAGVPRKSGEPYIQHPLSVALILAEMNMDAIAIAAALLHDVVEDTEVTLQVIQEKFGTNIANIVDGVTKFTAFELKKSLLAQTTEPDPTTGEQSTAETDEVEKKRKIREQARRQQAETVRKMFLAMAEDPRVVIVKLGDRLHNMRTLDPMTASQQINKAHETLDIYAPLAGRLGMSLMKGELEDLSFKYLEPEKYAELVKLVREEKSQRKSFIERICLELREEMEKLGIHAEVSGRFKFYYSLYDKMKRTQNDISAIHDLVAFRLLVDSVENCYIALGHIHRLFPPKDGRIKDYIANRKPNGYQSLHTTVFCPDGRLAEIQIRTFDMHHAAEYGLASHWYYKESGGSSLPPQELMSWITQLMDWQRELPATEFMESVKVDIFQDQIFIFTPKGDVRDLPVGSTPLDFAYRIHSKVGDHYSGARVTSGGERMIIRMVPMNYELKSGEVVEIVTQKNAKPTRDWLNFVKTANASSRIKHYLKAHERDIDSKMGQEKLDRELKNAGYRGLEAISDDDLTWLASAFRRTDKEDLFTAIGREEIRQHAALTRLQERLAERSAGAKSPAPPEPDEEQDSPVITVPPSVKTAHSNLTIEVGGASGMLSKLANCCHPVRGDAIVGYVSRGKGVIVHRIECKNTIRFKEQERLISVNWDGLSDQTYLAPILITAQDRVGIMADVATVVAQAGINMTSLRVITNPRQALITATIEVDSLAQLEYLFAKLRAVRGVISVDRESTKHN